LVEEQRIGEQQIIVGLAAHGFKLPGNKLGQSLRIFEIIVEHGGDNVVLNHF
jgi:hypothetical protein